METDITSKEKLEKAILHLEMKKDIEGKDLKIHFNNTYEQLRPINLIKNTIADIEHSPELKNDLIRAAIGLAIGYITKKIIVATSANPLMATIGSIVQIAVSGLIARNPDFIKKIAIHFLRFILNFRLQRQQLRLPENILQIK